MSLKPIGSHGCGSTPHDIFNPGDYAWDLFTIEYYPPLIVSSSSFFVIPRNFEDTLIGTDSF